ncbi:MAG: hypothetical protein AAGF53_13995 [Pseudomonadota bacterium]
MWNFIKKALGYEVAGLPVLATFAGCFILMSTMFMWYGGFFKDAFYFGMGITEDDVTAEALGLWYPIGMILSMSQGLGVAIILKWRNWPSFVEAITTALVAGFIATTTFSYRLIILPDHNHDLFYVNASGIITAFVLAAVVITALRPRKSVANDHEVRGLLEA